VVRQQIRLIARGQANSLALYRNGLRVLEHLQHMQNIQKGRSQQDHSAAAEDDVQQVTKDS
jgi:hypothetical protein